MRKKKWALPYLEEREDIVIFNPQDYQGKWRELLNCEVIHLEIGAGKGGYWNQMAHLYPNEGWIALEKSIDASAIGIKKCEPLSNMKWIVRDASELNEFFSNKEIDVIHLNFSDPWPKKRHTKRRLTSNTFLEIYDSLLNDSGKIIQKTDNEELFDYSLEIMSEKFELIEVDRNYRDNNHPEDAITEYEAEFLKKGQPIYRAIYQVKR